MGEGYPESVKVSRMTAYRPKSRNGAEDGTRTRDLRFTKPLLYQLSYFGEISV